MGSGFSQISSGDTISITSKPGKSVNLCGLNVYGYVKEAPTDPDAGKVETKIPEKVSEAPEIGVAICVDGSGVPYVVSSTGKVSKYENK